MPRPDRDCYRSGFWATIPIEPPNEPGELTLIAEARLDDGTTATAPLGTITVADPPTPIDYQRPSASGTKPLIAICMATYNPNLDLFHTQLESIRAQTDTDWVCLISDDCSAPESYEAVADAVAGDDRFILSRAERRLASTGTSSGCCGWFRRRQSSSRSATTTITGIRTSSQR